jgi:putative transposase
MKLDTNNHSVFKLQYHLILPIKYRRKVITNEISDQLLADFKRIGAAYKIRVIEWNHDQDHVHVLFDSEPDMNFSKFINAYKSASSRLIKKSNPVIRQQLWQEMFWSKSYCLITVGGAPLSVLKQYVQTQGKK